MERRNGFLTFICALIPGVGYMYLGLMERGIEALLIFLLVKPIFRLIGMGSLGSILSFAFWIYTFTDTYNIIRKMDRGEYVPDETIFTGNFKNREFKQGNYTTNNNGNENFNKRVSNIKKNKYKILGWILVVFGALAVANKAFEGSDVYYMVKSTINAYFIPVVFIILGIYILIKK